MSDRKIDPFDPVEDVLPPIAEDDFGGGDPAEIRKLVDRINEDTDARMELAREREAKFHAEMKKRIEIEDEILKQLPRGELFVTMKWKEIKDLYDQFVLEMAGRYPLTSKMVHKK